MRKLIYIAGPYAGDVEENVRRATQLGKLAVSYGLAPVVPHLLGKGGMYGDPTESIDDGGRERALSCCVALASMVGRSGGHMWVILQRDGTQSRGSLLETEAWLQTRRQAYYTRLTWDDWEPDCNQL